MYRKEFKYKVFFIKMGSEKQKQETPKYCSHCGRELHVREKRTHTVPKSYDIYTGKSVGEEKHVLEEFLYCREYGSMFSPHDSYKLWYSDVKADKSNLYLIEKWSSIKQKWDEI